MASPATRADIGDAAPAARCRRLAADRGDGSTEISGAGAAVAGAGGEGAAAGARGEPAWAAAGFGRGGAALGATTRGEAVGPAPVGSRSGAPDSSAVESARWSERAHCGQRVAGESALPVIVRPHRGHRVVALINCALFQPSVPILTGSFRSFDMPFAKSNRPAPCAKSHRPVRTTPTADKPPCGSRPAPRLSS